MASRLVALVVGEVVGLSGCGGGDDDPVTVATTTPTTAVATPSTDAGELNATG